MTSKGKRLNPFEHALKRPDTYIGSTKTISAETYIYDDEENRAVKKMIDFNPGLFNIIREILSNVIDNVWRSTEAGTPMKKIEIRLDTEKGSICIWNDGYCIPVKKEDFEYKDHRTGKVHTERMYPAESFFGDMLSGTNYDDDEIRKTSGRNGMGSKATNVFSTEFIVEHTSTDDKKKFEQTFTKNGSKRSEPKIVPYRNKTGYTSITFTPDYEYFGYPGKEDEDYAMDDNLVALIKLYAYEVAMITNVPVKFSVDGEALPLIRMPNLEKFVRLFYPSSDHKITSIKSPLGDECVIVERGEPEMDVLEDVPQISFVNGIRTKEGGIHVDTWRDGIFPGFVRMFNARKGSTLKTTSKEVYPYLQIFIRCEVDKPQFATQTKEQLTGIGDLVDKNGKKKAPEKYKLFNPRKKTEKDEWAKNLDLLLKKIVKWDFVALLDEKLQAKQDRIISRKEGVTKGKLALGDKATDANKAGSKEWKKCTLYITEGDSAKALADRGIASIGEKGHDYNGSLPIRGKFLNVRKASAKQIVDNKEIDVIRKMLGLQRIDYSKDENFAPPLRYGKVRILADADDDGIHIRGLLLSFFHFFYPGLFDRGYFQSFSTSVVTVKHGKGKAQKVLQFYSKPEYDKWSTSNHKLKSHIVKYIKGLGTINPQEAPAYFKDEKVLDYFLDGTEKEIMNLGFTDEKDAQGIKGSDQRKVWITDKLNKTFFMEEHFEESGDGESSSELLSSEDEEEFQYEGDISLSTFVDKQLIIYHTMALRRALPGIWDGLKESQRKILFTFFLRNYKGTRDVEKISGAVKEETAYHHGIKSLQDAIINMVQGFVGSNNIPYAINDGEFGTRSSGGKDAASARYPMTGLEEIIRTIFPSEDDALLERLEEDNEKIEYAHYMPILPMLLVNGASGIASGYSTTIPCYNPEDLVEWIETWLEDEEGIEELDWLTPWYRGYTGEIELTFDKETGYPDGWISKGILEKGKMDNTRPKGVWWHIRELPVGVWTDNFKAHLEELETDKNKKKMKCLHEVKNYCTANTVHFMIKPTSDFTPDIETVGNLSMLKKKYSLKNMVAIDENNYPYRFQCVEDILKVFCQKRLYFYGLRKKSLLKSWKIDLVKATNRYRFVKGVVDKKLDLHQDDEDVEATLEGKPWKFDRVEHNGTPSYEYLLSLQMRSMTQRKLDELKKEADNLRKKIEELEGKNKRDLWREDLAKFKKAYTKFLKTRREE